MLSIATLQKAPRKYAAIASLTDRRLQGAPTNAIGGAYRCHLSWGPVKKSRCLILALLPVLSVAVVPARAQMLPSNAGLNAQAGDAPMPADDKEITFAADTMTYDSEGDIVTASGHVRMAHQDNRLSADRITWHRKTGRVLADGNVMVSGRVEDGKPDRLYGESMELTDTLKDGVVENLLLVLKDGGRLVAAHGSRVDGASVLEKASYSPCAVIDAKGCPKDPTWRISALRVKHDPIKHRISYDGARISILGAPVIWLPGLSHPDGSQGGGSGLLVPDVRYSRVNGIEYAQPYYFRLAPNRDLTVTPHVFSNALPAIEAHYRTLSHSGAWQANGMLTYGSRVQATSTGTTTAAENRTIRGYIDANGQFQLDSYWTITGATRLASDRTFMRRYDISRDDRLRSVLNGERISADSYLSIAGWAVQTLRTDDVQGQQAIALPAIDYRRRVVDPVFGSMAQFQINSLAILRTEGQDTQRAFAGLRWDLKRITPFGQEVLFTAYGRGDIYHTSSTLSTATASYRGAEGWTPRAIAAIAAEMRWPFAGRLLSGDQQITPRIQIVASPAVRNLDIPNEDARSIELEDSNLFALNRFSGYDRWEDSSRLTYGIDWAFNMPKLAVRSTVGQSIRFDSQSNILPMGTGLSDRVSDIVGRTTIRYGNFIEFAHRFRVDKSSLAVRRNEIDTTIGSHQTYLTIGYLRLNRNIAAAIEDLRDREELRLGGRVKFARYWSAFGSAVVDLTGKADDPLTTSSGYQPVRHRLGVAYDDECIEIAFTWRRDYDAAGDARRGNSYLLRLALKNLGR